MPTDLRHQAPIPKAELKKVGRPEKLSNTSLGKFDKCPRSFWLYLKHKGGPQSHPMARGECWHDFRERFIGELRDGGEPSAPPEVGKDLMNAVIAERKDLVLPAHEQHALRGMAWNFAAATVIDPDAVLGLEQMIEMELGDWTIRGKLDFAAMTPFGWILVEDDKTSLSIPSQDDVENGAKGWQSWFYPLLVAFGIPEDEDLPLGAGVDEFRFRFSYPRFTNSETGEIIYREVARTRDQLADFRNTLLSHLERIDHGLETGEFPASPGSHCFECPARSECPIPEQYHELENVTGMDDAVSKAEAWHTRDLAQRRLKKSLRAFADAEGEPIFYGDYALDFRYEQKRSVDWDAIEAGNFDPERDIKISPSTKFDKRRQTPEEREERDAA
jgi:hypothetical protein